jgi:predicted membrane channel-forming protein YqfA (hemolysin III family)
LATLWVTVAYKFDEHEFARARVVFYVTLLVGAILIVAGGIFASVVGEPWGVWIIALGIGFFVVAVPGYLWARKEKRKLP